MDVAVFEGNGTLELLEKSFKILAVLVAANVLQRRYRIIGEDVRGVHRHDGIGVLRLKGFLEGIKPGADAGVVVWDGSRAIAACGQDWRCDTDQQRGEAMNGFHVENLREMGNRGGGSSDGKRAVNAGARDFREMNVD